MEKQKILYQQARLHARGAAEMVLQMISASKGNHLINCSKIRFSSSTHGSCHLYVFIFIQLKKQLFVFYLQCV